MNEEGLFFSLCLYFSASFQRERAAQGCTVCHSLELLGSAPVTVGYTDSKTIFQFECQKSRDGRNKYNGGG